MQRTCLILSVSLLKMQGVVFFSFITHEYLDLMSGTIVPSCGDRVVVPALGLQCAVQLDTLPQCAASSHIPRSPAIHTKVPGQSV